MKTIRYHISKVAFLCIGSLLLLSCNKFLDVLPDNRTEIDTPEKITGLLVSAYTAAAPYGIMEMMTDNVTDYGSQIDRGRDEHWQSYCFQPISGQSYDTPHLIWSYSYSAIAAANKALEAIEEYDDKEALNPQKGEALLCRAFTHFLLCNAFCLAYNTDSNTNPGIPYVTELEDEVFIDYDRGTVDDVYRKIAADIEAGYPLINDSNYAKPLYHFTKRAAAAFACQFYLYYGKYDLAIKYGTDVLGDDSASLYRDWSRFDGMSSVDEYSNAFVSTAEPANILLHGFDSRYVYYRYARFVHTQKIMQDETLTSSGPWGEKLGEYSKNYVAYGRCYYHPKFREYFSADPVTGIGYPFVVKVAYSTEIALVNRAEAYVLSGDYEKAARDLCSLYAAAGCPVNLDAEGIARYYSYTLNETQYDYGFLDDSVLKRKKPISTEKFVSEILLGTIQEYLIHACLHARRIVCFEGGERLMDLKRYGIAYTHELDGEADIKIAPYDKRLAIQLPPMALEAGMQPNPTY